jgi:hypothetical protein
MELRRVKKITPLKDYKLNIVFDTGENFIFDTESDLYGIVGSPLKEKRFFDKVYIDKISGAITWETGFSYCSDYLYMQMQKRINILTSR